MKHILTGLISYLVLINCVTSQSLNTEDILGKWVLNKIMHDSVCVMDLDNPTIAIDIKIADIKKRYSNFSSQDSLELVKNERLVIKKMKGSYIKFKDDNGCIISKPQNRGKAKKKAAKYKIDNINNEIILDDGSSRDMFLIYNKTEKRLLMSSPSLIGGMKTLEYRKEK